MPCTSRDDRIRNQSFKEQLQNMEKEVYADKYEMYKTLPEEIDAKRQKGRELKRNHQELMRIKEKKKKKKKKILNSYPKVKIQFFHQMMKMVLMMKTEMQIMILLKIAKMTVVMKVEKVMKKKKNLEEGDDNNNKEMEQDDEELRNPDNNNTDGQLLVDNTNDTNETSRTKKKWRPKLVQCVRCHKWIQSLQDTFVKHYRAKHSEDIGVEGWADEIAEARVRQPPKNTDTRDTRYRVCKCGDTMSYQNLMYRHMVLDHPSRCASISEMKIDAHIMQDPKKMKKWTSAMVNSLPKTTKEEKDKKPPIDQFYCSTSQVTVIQITELVRKWNSSMQGRLEVDQSILKKKKNPDVCLTPEEYKVWYRPITVQNHQKKVMHYIFGNEPFTLDEIHKIGHWLATEEERGRFMTKIENDKKSEHSYYYIANLARSMLHFIEYINQHYSDPKFLAVVGAVERKIRAVERNATKKAERMRKRSSILKEKDQTIPLEDLTNFTESETHTKVMNQILEKDFEKKVHQWP